jgi:acyl carrier protein phosphodiesterase
MNYLAHLYLSFDHDQLLVGNFIADHIRGNRFGSYPPAVQKGIRLHRWIDSYTDEHPLVRSCTRRLHPTRGHYSRVAVDMFFDHFLSVHWKEYSRESLEQFVDRFYSTIHAYKGELPDRTRQILPYMIEQGWLLQYGNIDGLDRSLKGLWTRTGKKSSLNTAVRDLERYYTEFETDFMEFFPELIRESLKKVYTFLHQNGST